MRSEMQVARDLGEQREERGHDLGLDVARALDANVLLERQATSAVARASRMATICPRARPSRERSLTTNRSPRWRRCISSSRPAALVGSLSRGGRLDERVDADVVVACVLEDGEALAAHVLLCGRDPQRGDGFHGLSMECGFGYFSGQIRTMERVLFPATTLFGQNVRLCLTAPCRSPPPTSLAPV